MSYALRREPPPIYPVADPRSEFGWQDVKSALGKILQGYAVLIGGLMFCVLLIVVSVVQIFSGPLSKPPLGALWFFYLGLGLMSVFSILGYGMIAVGKWRCLLSAPERFHCRWLMFTCMACLVMGPAINIAACTTGLDRAPALKGGPAGFQQVKFSRLGAGMQIVSGVAGFASLVLFVFFLRGVAQCFNDRVQILLTNAYLAYLAFLTAATAYAALLPWAVILNPILLLSLAGGWLMVFLGYLTLIVLARGSISRGLAGLRSPLAPMLAPETTAPAARAWPVI
jgi:hypothetical protein